MEAVKNEDFNVGMLDNEGNLRQWFSCPNCGNEGFKEEYDFSEENGLCKDCREEENEQ